MTRIISGRAGGIVLDVPGRGTRPTSDRVRESLFGALESAGLLDGAQVADLYAGSGALGLEALSRGAVSADLVELSAPAATVVERNAQRVLRALGDGVRARVHRLDTAKFLGSHAAGEYDLAFLDPPYDVSDDEVTSVLTRLAARLLADGVVIVERARRSPAPAWGAAGLEALRDRTYGDTTMWWGQLPADPSSR